MPLYEYYCSACRDRFELLRSMGRSNESASCPECDAPSPRAISVFASVGRSTGASAMGGEMPEMGGGSMPEMGGGSMPEMGDGCCGGGCGCS